ncbi:MAG: hypothetical protein ABEN55_00485 [Bradymonadaceae bacterium]
MIVVCSALYAARAISTGMPRHHHRRLARAGKRYSSRRRFYPDLQVDSVERVQLSPAEVEQRIDETRDSMRTLSRRIEHLEDCVEETADRLDPSIIETGVHEPAVVPPEEAFDDENPYAEKLREMGIESDELAERLARELDPEGTC